ncbi:hypothetical protein [Streptacidiphilus neutrinimicus]|uniref:hypothetical protein n=1 Tax=Streptacidiphilus neutrinimicus TaxID=105420 RepID=UPI0005AB10D9|nr:hypothetical protein [Streptacidiphilus neutrinimicus]
MNTTGSGFTVPEYVKAMLMAFAVLAGVLSAFIAWTKAKANPATAPQAALWAAGAFTGTFYVFAKLFEDLHLV